MRKRGKRFTRRLDPLAAFRSASRQHPLDPGQKRDLGNALHTHLEALRTGAAGEMAFHQIAGAVNMSMVLAEKKIGDEYSREIGAAQEALLRLWQRGKTTGRWLCDGPGLVALTTGVAVYEAQIAVVSRQEAADAMREVIRRVEQGHIFEEQLATLKSAA